MWHRVGLVRTDFPEKDVSSIFRVEEIRVLETTLAVTRKLAATANIILSSKILSTLEMEVTVSSETSVLTRPALYHILEDDILYSHRREYLTS
jgi:hypothetical protein